MSLSAKYVLCLAGVCLLLVVSGCAKKRIYADPNPPGATPRQTEQAKTSSLPAGARLASEVEAQSAPEPAAEPATQQAAEPVAEPGAAKAAANKPVELGTALADEPDLLSGTAGILDDELIGFPLAGGGTYDPDQLVAGHRTLPLGGKVEVTDVATGRTVLVTIADRGPFDKARIIDLSRRAATELGMADSAEVRLKLVGADLTPTAAPAAASDATSATATTKTAITPASASSAVQTKTTPGGSFYVQVGAFEDQANAQSVQDALTLRGVSGARLVGNAAGGGLIRVQAGPYADRAEAEAVLESLRTEYPAAFVIRPD